MTASKHIKPKVTLSEKQAQRADHMNRIMGSHFVVSREPFTVADISSWLGGVDQSMVRSYLNNLADAGKLNKKQIVNGSIEYSRKPLAIMSRMGRTMTDEQLGIVA
jgi:hypothetical protein